MFNKQYIQKLDTKENAFAQWGSFGHLLFEKYYKNELEFYELSPLYEKDYHKNITLRFPPNAYVDLNESYYNAGKEYFDNFEGDFEDCKILGVEQKISINIDKYKFTGFIDLVLENNDGIFIVDHKSKSKFKSKKEKNEYLRQLYLYSIYIYEKYKIYPYKLMFNMFRANNKIEETFNTESYEKSKQWAIDTIKNIYCDKEFKPKPDQFFCNYLCSVNIHCPCSDKYLGGG